MELIWAYGWPLGLVVAFEILYQLLARKLSAGSNPLSSLGWIYLFSALLCAVLFECLVPGGHIVKEVLSMNPGAVIIGISVAFIETGTLYMYKAGWQISTGFIVYTALSTMLLVLIGVCAYGEPFPPTRLLGLILAGAGIFCMSGSKEKGGK